MGDWENNKGLEYKKNGEINSMMKVKLDSWLGGIPEKTHSSMAMTYLYKAVRASMKRKK
jgi:hypothetical protein